MFRDQAEGYIERVDVIGNKRFIEFVEQLEHEEGIKLDTFEVGKDKVVILTIEPVPEKLDRDIALPVLSPILTRKKSLAEEIAALDVSKFQCPILPRKEEDKEAQNFKYEGYDLLTLKKIVDRDYTIPPPQTAEEVIGYYARRIAQDVKLPSQFASLVPKVREFLETRAFGGPVDLSLPEMVRAISSNVAHYVTVKAFARRTSQVGRRRAYAAADECGEEALRDAGLSLVPSDVSSRKNVSSTWFPVPTSSRRSSPASCTMPTTWRDSRSCPSGFSSPSSTWMPWATCGTTSQISPP